MEKLKVGDVVCTVDYGSFRNSIPVCQTIKVERITATLAILEGGVKVKNEPKKQDVYSRKQPCECFFAEYAGENRTFYPFSEGMGNQKSTWDLQIAAKHYFWKRGVDNHSKEPFTDDEKVLIYQLFNPSVK